jgi:hypothetical protein
MDTSDSYIVVEQMIRLGEIELSDYSGIWKYFSPLHPLRKNAGIYGFRVFSMRVSGISQMSATST